MITINTSANSMSKTSKHAGFLRQFDLFKGIPLDVVQSVERRCLRFKVKPREIMYTQNSVANHLYFLIIGEIKLSYYLKSGKEMAYKFAEPGHTFGEAVLMGEDKRSDSAQVLNNEATFYRINKNVLLDLVSGETKWQSNVSRLWFQRLKAIERKSKLNLEMSSRARIHLFLVELVQRKGRKVGTEDYADFPYNHYDVAVFTQTSRQTVTSLFCKLRDENHIYLNRGKLLIRDLNNFKKLKV